MSRSKQLETANNILSQAGLKNTPTWVSICELDGTRVWVLDNMDKLTTVLPTYIIGNLDNLKNDDPAKHRRTLLAFLRRLCQYTKSFLLRKKLREFNRKNEKRRTIYGYKIVAVN